MAVASHNTRQFHAHCVCVVGKTTVCRIFSCQRPFGAPPRTPARWLAGAPSPRSASSPLASLASVTTWQLAGHNLRSTKRKLPKTVEPAWRAGAFEAPASQHIVAYGAVTLCGQSFQIVRLISWLVTRRPYGQTGPTTPLCKHNGLGYVRVRSPLLAESLLFSVPPGTEMVHFPGLSSSTYGFS